MSQLVRIGDPAGVAPSGRYSHVVVGSGRQVFVSGQVAFDEQGKLVGEGDALAQARQVFGNIGRCLAAAGAGFEHLAKLTVFVTDIGYLPAVRTAWDEALGSAHAPASSAVQVAGLFQPGLLVEIEAYAVVPEAGQSS
ncbi:enamine deaminase RidA (YjgF/YER057c/UK114 family) [Kitasatospora gansuensis]|uniref:Enamine deaminase RidA (YjgF/YER057c/UK114 family) n=1 Tax=Kitasatospora gansuensis TaxID=258050 RepID=A0A7W7SA60_9ACTN|nr:RidA family protein [Kitasatospora gansuensis]MBB4946312.1 enamine deaminase RidA (YjgF/YER057c/UK114 family) [Kitasatospora gansuensis]